MKHRILVVDDSPSVRRELRGALEPEFDVLEAEDGLRGWLQASVEPPDLIIADVKMPHLNGISLLKRLRAAAKTRSIPVVLLTARDRNVDMIHGLKSGGSYYITKPFNADDLCERVRRLVNGRSMPPQAAS